MNKSSRRELRDFQVRLHCIVRGSTVCCVLDSWGRLVHRMLSRVCGLRIEACRRYEAYYCISLKRCANTEATEASGKHEEPNSHHSSSPWPIGLEHGRTIPRTIDKRATALSHGYWAQASAGSWFSVRTDLQHSVSNSLLRSQTDAAGMPRHI
jgi:hypothetical protein